MHTNRISPARKITLWLTALLALALFSGCETVTLTDLTPKSMDSNPSNIYTFSLRVTPRSTTVSGVAPRIVVDGQNYGMKKSALGEGIYDFEYQLPAGRDRLAYYFLVNYNVEDNGTQSAQETYTQVEQVQIIARKVLKIESSRGPVGALISVVGRGFTPQDAINVSGTPARTVFYSPNSISFYVPALEPGRNYQVTLTGIAGDSPVGTFRVDPSTVSVSPGALTLRTGERQSLSFTLANPAPTGGTLLDVTTDVPESIIMPEVMVPAGQTTATITVEGGKPGTGSLFLKGFGSGEVNVSVSVTAR
ncbi:MAG: IPT/TIG domain-containing protein [Opitutaceae bacterium]